jgi:hypothetical protein
MVFILARRGLWLAYDAHTKWFKKKMALAALARASNRGSADSADMTVAGNA